MTAIKAGRYADALALVLRAREASQLADSCLDTLANELRRRPDDGAP
jgi:hypothetical protein